MAEFTIQKILVPVDFSKPSLRAIDYAETISKKTGADIFLLNVTEIVIQSLEPGYFVPPPGVIEQQENLIDQAKKHLSVLAEQLRIKTGNKVSVNTTLGAIGPEISSFAEKKSISLIVMGTNGVSGIQEFIAGSNTFRVIKNASCPVLSVRAGKGKPAFNKILVPFRDKPHSREKINYAIDFARIFSSEIYLLGIDTEFTEKHKKKIQLEAKQIKNICAEFDVKCKVKVISKAYAGEEVIKYAKSIKADLIISMADLDKMNIAEYFTGPFAQQIVNHSPVPVMSIRPLFNTDTIDLRFY